VQFVVFKANNIVSCYCTFQIRGSGHRFEGSECISPFRTVPVWRSFVQR